MALRPNILVCCSGSVAVVKVPEIVVQLNSWANVLVICSSTAKHFLERANEYNPQIYEEFLKLQNSGNILITDSHEWIAWNRKGDPVLHIELRRWADILLLAPASANTIAKAATGICDNLLLCVVRAWDRSRPSICCPAMNTIMLDHPSMKTHLVQLQSYGFTILESEFKNLACGEMGKGALASVQDIIKACQQALLQLPPENPNRIIERKTSEEIIFSIIQASSSVERTTLGNSTSTIRNTPNQITHVIVTMFIIGFLLGFRCSSHSS